MLTVSQTVSPDFRYACDIPKQRLLPRQCFQKRAAVEFYRLQVSAVYFIGGFGVMGWITAEEYRSALPDPLAKAAPRIIRHMNDDHADALRLIAHRFAGDCLLGGISRFCTKLQPPPRFRRPFPCLPWAGEAWTAN